MRVDDVDALGRPQVDVDTGHRGKLGRPRSRRVDHHTGSCFRELTVRSPVADADDVASVANQLCDAGMVHRPSAVVDCVLDVRED